MREEQMTRGNDGKMKAVNQKKKKKEGWKREKTEAAEGGTENVWE